MKQFVKTLIILAVVIFFCSAFATAETNLKSIGTSEQEIKTLLIDGYKAEARKWLGYARDRLKNNEIMIDYCRKYLAKGNLTLKDIGTSEQEIKTLLIDGYKAEAKKWLGYARQRFENNEMTIDNCRKYLAKGNLTLKDIGTSEQEIKILLIDGYKAEAKTWLGYARQRFENNENNIKNCLKFLRKAGAVPESIGTTKKELCQL